MKDRIRKRLGKVRDFEFVPLIMEDLCVECALEFRILRGTHIPGKVADIDNLIKILVDALKTPTGDQIEGAALLEGEIPFFTLLHDDRLVSKITSTTDELLQPILGKDTIEPTDIRVFLDVYVRPRMPVAENVVFFTDDTEIWRHDYQRRKVCQL